MRFRIRTVIGMVAAVAVVLTLLRNAPVLAPIVLGSGSALLLIALEAKDARQGAKRLNTAECVARFLYYSDGGWAFWLGFLAVLERTGIIRI